jgi:hypothetical protein
MLLGKLMNNHFALSYEHNEQSMGAYITIVPWWLGHMFAKYLIN